MDRMLGIIVLMLLHLLHLPWGWASKQPAEGSRSALRVMQKAIPMDEPDAPAHSFVLGADSYVVQSVGRGQRRSSNAVPISFKLPTPSNDWIEHLWYSKHNDGLLLMYQHGDGETGTASFTRLDERSLKAVWTASVPGFNVGPALIEGAHVHLTAIGFIGRLNLQTGKYAWKHANLYEPLDKPKKQGNYFNAFLLPIVRHDEVVFVENGSHGADQHGVAIIKAIRVNKRTGRINSISRLQPAVAGALSSGTHPAYRDLGYSPHRH
jgi:hypothetical protein